MAIRIKKIADALYTAQLSLPDMPAVKEPWSTSKPMIAVQIIEELLRRGAHQTDIGDAFYAADPDWLKH